MNIPSSSPSAPSLHRCPGVISDTTTAKGEIDHLTKETFQSFGNGTDSGDSSRSRKKPTLSDILCSSSFSTYVKLSSSSSRSSSSLGLCRDSADLCSVGRVACASSCSSCPFTVRKSPLWGTFNWLVKYFHVQLRGNCLIKISQRAAIDNGEHTMISSSWQPGRTSCLLVDLWRGAAWIPVVRRPLSCTKS